MEHLRPKVRLIPECHADTALASFLTNGFPNIDHEAGIHNVVKNFTAVKDKTYGLVGLIDDDKRKPSYLDDFIEVKSAGNVALLKKPGIEHYVIILKPAIERFLLGEASNAGISLLDFNLPDQLKTLCKTTKKPQIKKNQDYFAFLLALKEKKTSGIVALEGFLRDFTSAASGK
jgi:hypothetical protein